MKLSRILPLLLMLCVAPFGLSAQDEGPEQPANITVQAAAGSVILVDGQEVTVPESGAIEVPAGATLSSPSATRITLASGASVVLGSGASIQVDEANAVAVGFGSVAFMLPNSDRPVTVGQGQRIDSTGSVTTVSFDDAPAGQNDGFDVPEVFIPEEIEQLYDTGGGGDEDELIQDPTQVEVVPTPL